MREQNRDGSIFTRIVGHDFLMFNRFKRGAVSPMDRLARLKWTKELKTFSLLGGGWWSGFNVKRPANFVIPELTNVSLFNDRKLMRSQFFFKTLTLQFLVKRAMYFSACTVGVGRYYLLKWIITLAVCGLFAGAACFTFLILLVIFVGASSGQLWFETLLLDANAGWCVPWIIERCYGYLFLFNACGYDTLGEIADPLNSWFRWTNVSFVFQDFELFFSFTDFFSNALYPLTFLEARGWARSYALVLCGTLVSVLLLFFCRVLRSRADFWVYFFNITYYSNWSTRAVSFDYLSQILGRGVTADSKLMGRELLNFAVGGTFGLQPKTSTRQVILYYFSQTVGGYSGFVDLFPSIGGYVNENRLGLKSLKTFKRFALIRNYLSKKVNTPFSAFSEVKFLNLQTRLSVRANLLAHTRPVSSYLGRHLPESYLSKFWLYVSDFFVGISRVGDLAAMSIRSRWFTSTVVRNYGFWFISFFPNLKKDSLSGGISPEVPKVLWYSREINVNAVRNRLDFLFRGSSSLRFKVGYHSLLNDFSFWRADFNPEGEHEYFSFWVGFSEDNSYASSVFKESKFGVFEPTSTLTSFGGGDVSVNDDEDSSNPEFVDSYAETYFEDNFLQKDVSLVFFDDSLAEKVTQLRVTPDEDGLSYYQAEALEDVVSSEYLMYGAGQEGDLAANTSSMEYSALYTKEYGGGLHYKENVVTSIYDDLADYWGLHSTMLVSRVTKIPTARLPFSRDFTFKKVRYNWDFRKRTGRILYFYWNLFHAAMITNYVSAWKLEVMYFGGFVIVISIFMVNTLGFFSVNWGGIFASTLFLGFAVAIYSFIFIRLGGTQRVPFFGTLAWLFFFYKWAGLRGITFESRVMFEKWLVGLEVMGSFLRSGSGSQEYLRNDPVVSVYSRFLTSTGLPTSFFFLGVLTPTFVAHKIFENVRFTRSLAYISRILSVEANDFVGLVGKSRANTELGVAGNFYVSCTPYSAKFFSTLCAQGKFGDLSLFGDLSVGGAALNGRGFDLGGLTRDYLFEDCVRLQWKDSLIAGVSGTPTPVSVFEKYYLRSFSSLEFYPTLSSKSVYWSLLWAKITFANTVWPQAGGFELFDSTVSRLPSVFNGSKINLGGQSLGTHTRNRQKFFNFFQHYGVNGARGSVFAVNFLRAFTFKRALAYIFTLSYHRAITASTGGIYYRTYVRYMPYRKSLSCFVGD